WAYFKKVNILWTLLKSQLLNPKCFEILEPVHIYWCNLQMDCNGIRSITKMLVVYIEARACDSSSFNYSNVSKHREAQKSGVKTQDLTVRAVLGIIFIIFEISKKKNKFRLKFCNMIRKKERERENEIRLNV
ncbi:hypothetical protein BpHYR1_040238, partial [Brachionus plicatilis]